MLGWHSFGVVLLSNYVIFSYLIALLGLLFLCFSIILGNQKSAWIGCRWHCCERWLSIKARNNFSDRWSEFSGNNLQSTAPTHYMCMIIGLSGYPESGYIFPFFLPDKFDYADTHQIRRRCHFMPFTWISVILRFHYASWWNNGMVPALWNHQETLAIARSNFAHCIFIMD